MTNAIAKGTVLVTDDEPGMRQALREVLGRAGWKVELAECGEEALEILRAAGAFDLLITDFRMGGMTGLELVREAQRAWPAMPIVMMTAYGTVEDAVEAMREGASDYLLKPFSMATVLEVVARATQGAGQAAAQSDEPSPATTRRAAKRREPEIIAVAPALRAVLEIAREVADANATVLLTGESGTGKEVVARYIHTHSRRTGPMVAINCAALPEGLLESELFGHEKGAFTGAVLARKGRFEQANGGTLLLDEISEMPLALQAKLLRVIQEKEIVPVGGNDSLRLDVRIIATTNRDLEREAAEGRFRQDLFYRLNVIALPLPPLRERLDDIIPLAEHFMNKYTRATRPARRLGQEIKHYLLEYPWPGNVRELENLIERATLLARNEEIVREDLYLRFDPIAVPRLGTAAQDPADGVTLEEMERRLILQTLDRTGGNRTRTADLLGVSVRTIRNKINQYGLNNMAGV
jgi:two-component system response regulator FlrC